MLKRTFGIKMMVSAMGNVFSLVALPTKCFAYWQSWNIMVSKIRIGPVLPMIVSGWPENRWKTTPQTAAPTILSKAAWE